jgi:hypothetical protein
MDRPGEREGPGKMTKVSTARRIADRSSLGVTKLLSPKLKKWLEDLPFYDPEGWSLAASGESLNQKGSV